MRRILSCLFGAGLVAVLTVACGGGGSSLRRPEPYATEHAADGRFAVVLTGKALQSAKSVHVDLPTLVSGVLGHVDAMLPGPKTAITVDQSDDQHIPETGVDGRTYPSTGTVAITFGATSRVSLSTVLRTWLPQTLAHEADHTVRVLAGPGPVENLL